MEVTVLAIFISVMALQPENALSPIELRLFGSGADFSEAQLKNALAPIVATVSGTFIVSTPDKP